MDQLSITGKSITGGLTVLTNSTFLGANATAISGTNNAVVIGANAIATQDNTIILGDNNLNVGIGLSNDATGPQNKLEINADNADESGLSFRQLNSMSATIPNPGSGVLSVDPQGKVILVESTSGVVGVDGADGVDGIDGVDGDDGTDGTNGIDGIGISFTTDNGDGTFTINYTDGNSFTTAATSTYSAGDGIDIVGNVISESKYQIGDFAQGGIVFWLDESGEHGLVCAATDQSAAMRWYGGTTGVVQSKGNGAYAGETNTAIIISGTVAIGDDGSTYAARICNEAQISDGVNTYGDWYLPSKEELSLMFGEIVIINATALENGGTAFLLNYYWSSTEVDATRAYVTYYNMGNSTSTAKSGGFPVRAIRAF